MAETDEERLIIVSLTVAPATKWFIFTAMRYLFVCLGAMLLALGTQAQTPVTIKLQNSKKEPVAFATVVIIPVPDTVNKITKVTDSAATAVFMLEKNRPYLVQVTSVGYEPVQKSITVRNDNATFQFVLKEGSKSLADVVVTATKPLMRQEDDKTIVDPENLAASSTNAYEIMEKTPGLFVDQDGNIYLSSTTPATVYINGREQKMSAADIATILKSLPPNAIASIEIMRTPSARYDASGSGGIVNVILKKGIKIGLTGSINAGINQGKYGNQFFGINLNNNNGKTTTYLNLQVSRRATFEQITTDRFFEKDTVLRQDALTIYPTKSFYIGFGVSHQLSKNWDISYDGRFNYNRSRNRSTNFSVIEKMTTGDIITNNEARVNNKAYNFNLNQGINLKYKIDTLGSEWTTDLSYTYAPNRTDQSFTTYFISPPYPPTSGDGELENRLHFFSLQTNLTKKFPHQITFETGLKTTNVRSRNNTDYFHETGGTRVKDDTRTGAYRYTESINSAYLQGSKNFSGVIVKIGTRMESTNMSGHQLLPKDTSFKLKRTDFFPYIYISRDIMKIMGYPLKGYLVYRRTISRPAYDYLNPSTRYIDPYLFETGNPTLRPQFTHNYEANISVDERPILAIGVNQTKDIFNQVVYEADSSRAQAFRTWDNLGKNKEVYFRALGAIPPGGRYFIVAGAQYNLNHYEGLYQNKPLSFRRGTWSMFTYQTFNVTPLTRLTLNGFVRFKGQQGFYELTTFGALNMSISQQMFKKKLTITLGIQDMFYTNKNEFVLAQGSVNAYGVRKGDTRRGSLNLRYNFGIRKKEENEQQNVEGAN